MKKIKVLFTNFLITLLVFQGPLAMAKTESIVDKTTMIPVLYSETKGAFVVEKIVNGKFGFEECYVDHRNDFAKPLECKTIYPSIIPLDQEDRFNESFNETLKKNLEKDIEFKKSMVQFYKVLSGAFLVTAAVGLASRKPKVGSHWVWLVALAASVAMYVVPQYLNPQIKSLESVLSESDLNLDKDEIKEFSDKLYNLLIQSIEETGEAFAPTA